MTLPSYFTRNIRTCHSCEFRTQQCQGECPCRIDGRHIIDHAREHDCPLERFPSRGLGDTIAWMIQRTGLERLHDMWRQVGIGRVGGQGKGRTAPDDCGCARRRRALNAVVPFDRTATNMNEDISGNQQRRFAADKR